MSTPTSIPVLDHGFVELVGKTGHVGLATVNAARCSFQNTDYGEDVFHDEDERLVRYLLQHGHTCYDSETEVLTSQGFVPWSDVTMSHELAAVDPFAAEMIGFERPARLVDEFYEGRMLALDTRDVSMLVTPDHNLYCSPSTTQEKRRMPEFSLLRADDVWQRPMRLLSCATTNLQLGESDKSLALFRFFGFYVGDGSVVSANRVGFHLKKDRKKRYLRSVLEQLGVSYTESPTADGRTKFYVHIQGADDVLRPYGLGAQEKTLPDSCLRLSMGRAIALLDGLRNSDGSEKRSTWTYSTVSRPLADKIQALGALNGFAFSLSETETGMFQLQARTRSRAPRVNDTDAARMRQINYSGRVYCAEVSTGLLVVRRNNKVHLSGNSPFRHAFFTFHIKAPLFVFRQMWKYQVGSTWREYEATTGEPLGIRRPTNASRMVHAVDVQIDTDQGCSWNELSGRYRVLEPEFYWPDEARRNNGRQSSVPAPELTAEMRDRMDRCYTFCMANYHAMLEAGVAKELARLVLPPAIYSECVWTVSLQAVLHFLDQRLQPDAQFEIREYAKAVLELIKPSTEDMGIRLS